jgi:hypothetical protein
MVVLLDTEKVFQQNQLLTIQALSVHPAQYGFLFRRSQLIFLRELCALRTQGVRPGYCTNWCLPLLMFDGFICAVPRPLRIEYPGAIYHGLSREELWRDRAPSDDGHAKRFKREIKTVEKHS